MKHYINAALALLRRRKYAFIFFKFSIVYTLMLAGMRMLVWGGVEFKPIEFQVIFGVVIFCLLLTLIFMRVDLGDEA